MLLSLPYSGEKLYKNFSPVGFSHWRKYIFFYLWGVSVLALGVVGGFPTEYPYIQLGKFFTIVYFLSYLINYISGNYNGTFYSFMFKLKDNTKSKIQKIWTRFKALSPWNYVNIVQKQVNLHNNKKKRKRSPWKLGKFSSCYWE